MGQFTITTFYTVARNDNPRYGNCGRYLAASILPTPMITVAMTSVSDCRHLGTLIVGILPRKDHRNAASRLHTEKARKVRTGPATPEGQPIIRATNLSKALSRGRFSILNSVLLSV